MCGIAGHIGRTRPTESQVAAAFRRLEHRGPDGAGLWSQDLGDGYICTLVFTRLAIQDLTPAANQPFHSGAVTMVFNGEIYNFDELRSSLERQGESFVSRGDTEVLARLLQRRGVAALRDLDGMFGLAWWDSESRKLTLARDPFGEKPLLLHRSPHDVWFASEVDALSAISGKSFRPNVNHVRRFLTNGYRSLYKSEETFHVDVESLRPGQVLTFDATAKIEGDSYFWQPRHPPVGNAASYPDAVALTREHLVKTVRRRLRSDVPVALSLSGGVDSSALLGIAVRALDTPLHTYTIRSGDVRYDDSAVAEATSAFFSVPNECVDVRDFDFLPELTRQVQSRGSPVLTMSSYAQYLLMRRVALDGYKVIIEGTGADEIFAGYYDHHSAFLADLARHDAAEFARARMDWLEGPGRFIRNPHLRDPDYLVKEPDARHHLYLDAHVFASLMVHESAEPFAESDLSNSLLRNRMLNELTHETLPVLLAEADSNAMQASIENRSPFLSIDLFDWAFQLPSTYLIRGGLGKAVLRDAVDQWVPTGVIQDREKRGFNLSIQQLVDVMSPRTQHDLLRDSPIWEVVARDRFRAFVDSLDVAANSRSKFLFSFLSARAFMEANTE